MSLWTHIFGTIRVDPAGSTIAQQEYILKTVLTHQPLVTGSEGNMRVNIVRGDCDKYSSHNEFDECISYKYGDTRNRRRLVYLADYPTTEECGCRWLLVIDSSFRDRTLRYTLREFSKWLNRLSKRVMVDDIFIRIEGDGGRKPLYITDYQPYHAMYEWTSRVNDTGEPAWYEYLLPDYLEGYPLKLWYKYSYIPEVDEEMARRKQFEDAIHKKLYGKDE